MPIPLAVLRKNPDSQDRPVGTATVAGLNLILTCAHVMRAGGYERKEGEEVRIRFNGSEPTTARLLKCDWIDSSSSGWPINEKLPLSLDVVALTPTASVEGTISQLRALDRSDDRAAMKAFGFPPDTPDGRESRFTMGSLDDARGLRQIDWTPGAFTVKPGFSGGPVWDTSQVAVGIIVARWLPNADERFDPASAWMNPITSVADLFARHGIAGLKIQPAIVGRYPAAAKLVDWVEERLAENPYRSKRISPLLPIKIAVSPENANPRQAFAEIERLHSGEDDARQSFEMVSTGRLIDLVNGSHLYLQAPGGAGKSFAQYEAVLAAVNAGMLPVFISVVEAGAAIGRVFAASSVEDKLEALFQVCRSKVGYRVFKEANGNSSPILLILDGLNETSAEAGQMLDLAVNIAANFSTVRLIVGDRLTLRQNYPDSFRLATVAPVGIDQIEAAHPDFAAFTPEYKRLLRVPFFLDLVLESQGLAHNTRREIILRYIGGLLGNQAGPETHGNADANIAVLAAIAYEAYRDGEQLLRAKVFRDQLVQLDPQRLAEAGLLRAGRTSQTFVFRHQLLHDCLAAQHFHSNQLNPDETNLNILTLKRRSAEALVFVLEGGEPERSDEFITHIYDWDHGITLSCLVETRTNPQDALATAICAVLAEKLEDTFLHTRQRPQSRIWALRRFLGTEDLSAENVLGQLRETKERFDVPLLRSWWPVFTAEQVTPVLWEALIGLEPMPGWSAAAAFRRLLARAPESARVETLERLTILYHALRNQMERKVKTQGRCAGE
jgi:hypothetical protein